MHSTTQITVVPRWRLHKSNLRYVLFCQNKNICEILEMFSPLLLSNVNKDSKCSKFIIIEENLILSQIPINHEMFTTHLLHLKY